MTTNNNLPPQPAYEQYRGLRALLLTRVSTPGQSHEAQERVIREKLIEPLGLILDKERHVIHDTYTGLEYRYRAALDDILRMAERQEFDLLCLDVLDRGLGRKGVSREIFRNKIHQQWDAAQRKLEKLHQKCAVMREKLINPTYEPDYQTKRDFIEFLGITATIWGTGHNPRFKIEVNPPEIVSSHRWI